MKEPMKTETGTRRDFRDWLNRKLNISYTIYSRFKTQDKKDIYKKYISGVK